MIAHQTLFASALGLTPPWKVLDTNFSKAKNRLDIWVGFTERNTFTCPACDFESLIMVLAQDMQSRPSLS